MAAAFNPFVRLPWWVFVVLGVFFLPLALTAYQTTSQTEAEKAAALAGKRPALVDLGLFNKTVNTGVAGEVNIVAQIHDTHTVPMPSKGEDAAMFVLIGAADPARTSVARAVIIAENATVFSNWLQANVLGTGQFGQIFQINGMVVTSAESASIHMKLDEAGLTKSPDFVVIAPFIAGREVAYAPVKTNLMTMPITLLALGALFIFHGLKSRRQSKAHNDAMAQLVEQHEKSLVVPAE